MENYQNNILIFYLGTAAQHMSKFKMANITRNHLILTAKVKVTVAAHGMGKSFLCLYAMLSK